MRKVFRKSISFTIAICLFIGIVIPSKNVAAEEKEYVLQVIADSEYSDGVKFGEGYLMLKNGTFDNINADTQYIIIDKDGNKKEIENNIGFTEIYTGQTHSAYSIGNGAMLVGKNNKVALIDTEGNLYGGNENFYKWILPAGESFFYTSNQEGDDLRNASNWTLRKKDGSIIKEVIVESIYYDTINENGYEYIISREEGNKNKLIIIDSTGKVLFEKTGDYKNIGYDSGYILISNEEYNVTTVFKDGIEILEIEFEGKKDLSKFEDTGFIELSNYSEESGRISTLIDRNGTEIVDNSIYEQVVGFDSEGIYVLDYEGNRFVINPNGDIIIDMQEYAKTFGESFEVVSGACYYVDGTIAVTIADTKVETDIGTTMFIDKEGNKLYSDVEGKVCDFDGVYAHLYDKNDESHGVVNKDGSLEKRGFSYLYLDSDEKDVVVAIGYSNDDKEIWITNKGKEIRGYEKKYFTEYKSGHAIVKGEDKEEYGVVNTNMDEIIPVGEYQDIILSEESEVILAKKNGRPCIFDTDGNLLNNLDEYKEIGDYETKSSIYSGDTYQSQYTNYISENNIAITKNNKGEFGLVRVQKNTKQGWQSKNNKWYYYNENGELVKKWNKIEGEWYYFDNNGVMQTGWFEVNGTWYYLNGSGVMQTGWLKQGKSWYYLNGSGAMQTKWFEVNGTWYYSNESGVMQTGWLKQGKSWYYLSGSGAMKTDWFSVNGTWYYSNGSGVMKTGWLKNGGSWYYLNGSGAMQTGWELLSNKWYYFNNSGKMLTNTVVDGWTIDGNGVGTKIK